MKKILFALGLLSALVAGSCGPYKFEVEPVKVEIDVTHHISTDELLVLFKAQCRAELAPTATEAEIKTCAEAKLSNFLNQLAQALANQ